MYGFDEFIPLTEDEILKRVSQEDIVKMVIGYEPVLYQRICSPLRPWDSNPGAWFEYWNGKLMFQDFADSVTHRVPIRFVADYYNLTFGEALKFINSHYELGLGDSTGISKPKPIIKQQFEEKQNKERTNIIYKPRPWLPKDKSYWWYQYNITREQLIEDQVYGIIWYKIWSHRYDRWMVVRPKDSTYGYTEFKGRLKIYRPHGPKDYKFLSNCTQNDIGGLGNLPTVGNQCIITKGYKDYRVLKNEGCNSLWLQNEGCVPSDEILIDLCERFEELPVWFDNDNTGIEAAIKISSKINSFYPGKSYPLHLPESLLECKIKDPSDLKHKGQKEDLLTFLKERNLYGKDTSINT